MQCVYSRPGIFLGVISIIIFLFVLSLREKLDSSGCYFIRSPPPAPASVLLQHITGTQSTLLSKSICKRIQLHMTTVQRRMEGRQGGREGKEEGPACVCSKTSSNFYYCQVPIISLNMLNRC